MRYICQDKDCGRECTDTIGDRDPGDIWVPQRLHLYLRAEFGKLKHLYKCPYCKGRLKKKENND